MKVVVLIVTAVLCWSTTSANLFTTTGERIARHGYPWERHSVITADGYILNMYRIPHSSYADSKMERNKSAVLVLHGLMSSSDIFVMGGPRTDLVFLMADAGYDVWLGNARGNEYSQKHTSVHMSPLLPSYWAFSWHEIGFYDIPAMIDYISANTGQSAVHFVGHSQANAAFMAMLATREEYNDRIKTSHLLAPPIFMANIKSPIFRVLSPLLGNANELNALLGAGQFLPGDALQRALLPPICRKEPLLEWCTNIVCLLAGGPSTYTNMTLMPEYSEVHPADCSTRQLMHFMQERNSGKFRRYDFGAITNLVTYGSLEPPDYNLDNVNTAIPIDIYYSDGDQLVDVEDVHRLEHVMGPKLSSHHVLFAEFNHNDFALASNVREVINDCILDQINECENKPYEGTFCGNFKN